MHFSRILPLSLYFAVRSRAKRCWQRLKGQLRLSRRKFSRGKSFSPQLAKAEAILAEKKVLDGKSAEYERQWHITVKATQVAADEERKLRACWDAVKNHHPVMDERNKNSALNAMAQFAQRSLKAAG